MSRASLIAFLVALAACGDSAPEDVLATGTPGCDVDTDCAERVCWDVSDYDRECGGSVCSLTCRTDDDCQTAAELAEAPLPEEALCGSDERCVFLQTGLAAFLCIRPTP